MSTPHCSFVIYLNQDADLLSAFLRDLRGFFQKFPLHYELVAVIEKNSSKEIAVLEEAIRTASVKERITFVKNETHRGRAASLHQGLNKAEAPYLILADVGMATPLGDLFKILQHLMTEDNLDICWGERVSKKKAPFSSADTPRFRTERLFTPILKERNKNAGSDPLCEVVGIKKTAWVRLQENLWRHSVQGWYLHPPLMIAAHALNMSHIEIFVHDNGATSSRYSVWKERWSF